jgi:cell division protein FtsB
MKQIFLIAFLAIALIFLGVKIYSFWRQESNLNAELRDAGTRFMKTQTEGAALTQDVQYLANPENLEKELRSRFNYKKPGETMVVLVPGQSSTVSSTASSTQ